MKRLLSFLFMVCMTINLFADGETPSQSQKDNSASPFVAVSANYSLMSQSVKIKNETNKSDLNGFTFGVLFNVPITKHFVTLFGAQYQFGIKIDEESGMKITSMEHDAKVPLKFGYSADFGKKSQVCLYAGPSFLFCFSGTSEISSGSYKSKIDAISGKYEIGSKSGTNDSYKTMNVFDLQLGLGGIYRVGGFGIRLEYDWGVLNRMKKSGESKSYESQLTVGLMLVF